MLIRSADPTNTTPVDMDGAEKVSMQVMVGRQDNAPHFSLRHFVVEPGGHTPRHQHNYEHENYIIEGSGTIECDGDIQEIKVGDTFYIPANTVHQFCNSKDKPLRFLCLVPTSYEGDKPTPGS